MTREEKLKREYEIKLAELHREQRSCQHTWSEVKYDPEYKDEPVYETRWQGVDCFPVVVGFQKVKKDRWSKTCLKCGKVECAYALKSVKYEPDFK